ncbi:MAG: sigma-70 family RNA polymerase sigma factor [Prevotellaceae bacterium]|nr:sigma-70 family RNA polymerase sigma factor [Prevotellaceae bacterium]
MDKEEEFNLYFTNNFRKLFNFAHTIVDNSEVCRDIVHDVFEYYWVNYDRINSNSVMQYFYKMVRSRCLDYIKSTNTFSEYTKFIQMVSDRVEHEQNIEDYYDRILKAMDKLTPYNRHILVECYLNKKKYKQVADELNVSVAAVHKNIVKALRIIREETR